MWDYRNFIIGLVIGMIIAFLLIWILYASRVFVFSVCSRQQPICQRSDYFVDPADAMAHGSKIDDILFIDSSNEMIYKRPVRKSGCTPNGNTQSVWIKYPQYCSFSTTDGNTYEGKNDKFGSELYHITSSTGQAYAIHSSGNCGVKVSDDDFVTEGQPILKWDGSHPL